MHMEYRVSLSDHDFIVAGKHKLIPSVYAAVKIIENEIGRPDSVTYSGPTFVAVRSAKHSRSSANTHAIDFNRLFTIDSFDEFLKTKEKKLNQ